MLNLNKVLTPGLKNQPEFFNFIIIISRKGLRFSHFLQIHSLNLSTRAQPRGTEHETRMHLRWDICSSQGTHSFTQLDSLSQTIYLLALFCKLGGNQRTQRKSPTQKATCSQDRTWDPGAVKQS